MQTGCAFLHSKNAVVSGARMYRERTLLGFILLSRKSKNAKSVFLLSDALINPVHCSDLFAYMFDALAQDRRYVAVGEGIDKRFSVSRIFYETVRF